MSLTRKKPMARTSIKPKAPAAAGKLRTSTVQRQPRPRKCAVKTCHERFVPDRPFVTWCSPACGEAIAHGKLAKQRAAQERQRRAIARADKAATKQALEKFKKKPQWIAEVQAIFNAIVRLEDKDQPCISCGRFVVDGPVGGAWDAGHYLARGGSGHLRFDRRNVHKQCKGCNRPGGTTRAAFRAGMVGRIGLNELEALEADTEPRHYTIDDLKRMKTALAAHLRALKKGEHVKMNMAELLKLMFSGVAASMARTEADAAAFDAEARARRADMATENMPAVPAATLETQP